MTEKKVENMVENGKPKQFRGAERELLKTRIAEAIDRGADNGAIAKVLNVTVALVAKLKEEIVQERTIRFSDIDITEQVERKATLQALFNVAKEAAYTAEGNIKSGLINAAVRLDEAIDKKEEQTGLMERRRRRLEYEELRATRVKNMTNEELEAENDKIITRMAERARRGDRGINPLTFYLTHVEIKSLEGKSLEEVAQYLVKREKERKNGK